MYTQLTPPSKLPVVLQSHPAPPLDWLGLTTISYRVPGEPDNKIRTYEAVYRVRHGLKCSTKQQRGRLDANDIIAITQSNITPLYNKCLVVVMQYRPAVNAYTLEFPAGCIDPHETDAVKSALRELKEETGLTAMSDQTTVPYTFTYEPGISSSLGNAVTCMVDMDAPENQNVTPHLEDGEWSLQTFLLPLVNLHQTLWEFAKKHDHVIIDSRLGAYALGLDHAARLLPERG